MKGYRKTVKLKNTKNLIKNNSHNFKITRELLEYTKNKNSKLKKLQDEKRILINKFLQNLVQEFREYNNFQKVLLSYHEIKVEELLGFVFKQSKIKEYKNQFMNIGKFKSSLKLN